MVHSSKDTFSNFSIVCMTMPIKKGLEHHVFLHLVNICVRIEKYFCSLSGRFLNDVGAWSRLEERHRKCPFLWKEFRSRASHVTLSGIFTTLVSIHCAEKFIVIAHRLGTT